MLARKEYCLLIFLPLSTITQALTHFYPHLILFVGKHQPRVRRTRRRTNSYRNKTLTSYQLNQ